jgi:hypothetical protein
MENKEVTKQGNNEKNIAASEHWNKKVVKQRSNERNIEAKEQ